MSVRITDYGMDAVTSVDSNHSSNYEYFEKWHRYTAVGTGSTAPSQSDVALEAEVARTDSTGGFPLEGVAEQDATANRQRYKTTTYRVFDFTSSYNLAEYGHFTSSSGSNAVFRDLFRQDPNDPNSAAITISVQDGDQLQIIKTFIIEIPWEAVAKTITITGIGDLPGTHVAASVSTGWVRELIRALWPGENSSSLVALPLKQAVSTDRTTQLHNSDIGDSVNCTKDAYTSGSYTIRLRAKFETSQNNFDWYGWCAGGFNNVNVEYASIRFITDAHPAFTKADTHTLELVLDTSWARG